MLVAFLFFAIFLQTLTNSYISLHFDEKSYKPTFITYLSVLYTQFEQQMISRSQRKEISKNEKNFKGNYKQKIF